MTDQPDELMQRLTAADPVERQSLPSPHTNQAKQILENTMKSDPSLNSPPLIPAADEPVRMLDLPDVPGVGRQPRSSRSWGLLAGAAAAVVVMIAGFLVFSPDNTTPALAAVQGAAQATADADTGRISTVFALEGTDGVEGEQIGGRLDASYAGADIALSVELDDAVGTSGIGELPVADARLVDGVFYANDGSQWYAVDTGGFIGQALVDIVDPRTVLGRVQDLLETEEVGTVTLDGVETTQYRSIVDLGDDTLAESGWLPLEGVDIEAEGEIIVDLYVDDDGLLRRLDLAGDVQEPENGSGNASFTISTLISDIGGDISIEAPADATVIDPLEGFDASELFDGES